MTGGYVISLSIPCEAHGAHVFSFWSWVPEGEDSYERALHLTKLTFAVRMTFAVAAG